MIANKVAIQHSNHKQSSFFFLKLDKIKATLYILQVRNSTLKQWFR